MSDKERFWSHVNKNGRPPAHDKSMGSCWLWTAHLSDYPRFRLKGVEHAAHRFSWKLAKKRPAGPRHIRRKCDNHACVRPSHMTSMKPGKWPRVFSYKTVDGVCPAAIMNIRRQYSTGRYTQKALGEMVGLSRSTVGSIVRRETWKRWVPS